MLFVLVLVVYLNLINNQYFSPAEELVFIMEDGAKEASDMIILKNTLPYSIAFKVGICSMNLVDALNIVT